MSIVDERFTTQLITGKGKYYLFDDVHCMNIFVSQPEFKGTSISRIYVADFSNPGSFLIPKDAYILRGDELRSPMGGNTAAFPDPESLESAKRILGGANVAFESVFNHSP